MAPEFQPLQLAERAELLRLARSAIAAVLTGADSPSLQLTSAALLGCCGVFVSLHTSGRLRGCIGTLAAERSLYENVIHLAVVAAMEDPRFPPLSQAELPDTEIEISRLSAPTLATPEEVAVGRDGVCVTSGTEVGVFLPQVATRYGWDRERFLSEACRKAELAPDAWRAPGCQLFRFQAEVFNDRGETGPRDPRCG
ncbi:MAG: AmmeMemoRadiSam system protein A [Deltaproteobacteria bacterium]|nr:AmmeMemoRadiSam system protein A [Deltaproteobacteria bacterium]